MKVLHILSDENIGGAGILLLNLLRRFDPARVQSIAALPRGSALAPRIAALGVPVRELSVPCDRVSLRSVKELGTLMRREQIDLVHANAALCARLAAKQRGLPVVHTRHCCFPPEGIWRVRTVRTLGGVCNRILSDRVIATATAAADDLCALGIPRKKISVIINGSEAVREVGEAELFQARMAWGLTPDDFCVGICARLVPCKGHTDFLKAAKEVTERCPAVCFRFLIAGTGPEWDTLETLAHTLGLSHAVRFLGFLEDPAPFYRLLRIHVNCSTGTETSCLAVSEAMSAGVPTVAADYGGIPAMLKDSGAGILYSAGNAAKAAEAILQIASDAHLEASMKQAALSHFSSRFTAARMAQEVTELYEMLV